MWKEREEDEHGPTGSNIGGHLRADWGEAGPESVNASADGFLANVRLRTERARVAF